MDADGILVNTFDALELEAITVLQVGSVASGFSPVFSVGPLLPVRFPPWEPPKTLSATCSGLTCSQHGQWCT
jgi:hypothetical protein